MMANLSTTLNMLDATRNFTVEVDVNVCLRNLWRVRIGVWLIKVGAWVAGMWAEIKVND